MSRASKGLATVRDISRLTGMSLTTVSAVLAGNQAKHRIADRTAELIRNAAKEIGYLPNIAARSLQARSRGNRQVVIALITSIGVPINLIQRMLMAFHEISRARTQGKEQLTVALDFFEKGRLREVPGLLEGNRFNAAIICNTSADDDAWLSAAQFRYPVIIYGREIPGQYCVRPDDLATGRNAAEILLSGGANHPAVLLPPFLTAATGQRLQAFAGAVRGLLGRNASKIRCNAFSEGSAAEAVSRSLAANPKMDSLFCLSDVLALGAIHACHSSGRRIPEDMQIVGIGDLNCAAYLIPPLTVACYDSEQEAAVSAARLLTDLLAGKQPASKHIQLPAKVCLRASTRR